MFATRNRAAVLRAVLAAFARLDPVDGGWKLLVVDNNSEDDTQAVLAEFRDRIPLHALQEPRSGKSRALNRAIAAFDGDLVVVTDDDVLPEAAWLVALRRAADLHPAMTMFGGTVLPAWPEAPPHWLLAAHRELPVLYATIDRASGPCDYRAIFGPNMAIRRTVFDQGMRFAEDFGPDSSNQTYPMGSEWEFTRRLHQRGHRGWFVSDARVRHVIRPEQLTERWMLERAYRNGLGTGLMAPPRCTLGPARIGGLPTKLLGRCLAWAGLALGARLLPPSRLRLHLRFQSKWFAGLAEAIRRRSAERPTDRPTDRPTGCYTGRSAGTAFAEPATGRSALLAPDRGSA